MKSGIRTLLFALVASLSILGCKTIAPVAERLSAKDFPGASREAKAIGNSDAQTILLFLDSFNSLIAKNLEFRPTLANDASRVALMIAAEKLASQAMLFESLSADGQAQMLKNKIDFKTLAASVIVESGQKLITSLSGEASKAVGNSTSRLAAAIKGLEDTRRARFIKDPGLRSAVSSQLLAGQGDLSAASTEQVKKHLEYYFGDADIKLAELDTNIKNFGAGSQRYDQLSDFSKTAATRLEELNKDLSLLEATETELKAANIRGIDALFAAQADRIAHFKGAARDREPRVSGIGLLFERITLNRAYTNLKESRLAIDAEPSKVEREKRRLKYDSDTNGLFEQGSQLLARIRDRKDGLDDITRSGEEQQVKAIVDELGAAKEKQRFGPIVLHIQDAKRMLDSILSDVSPSQSLKIKIAGVTTEVRFDSLTSPEDLATVKLLRYALFQITTTGNVSLEELPRWIIEGSNFDPVFAKLAESSSAKDGDKYFSDLKKLVKDSFSSLAGKKALTLFYDASKSGKLALANAALITLFDLHRSAPFKESWGLMVSDPQKAGQKLRDLYAFDETYAELYAAYSADDRASAFDSLINPVSPVDPDFPNVKPIPIVPKLPMVSELECLLATLHQELRYSSFEEGISIDRPSRDMAISAVRWALDRFAQTEDPSLLKNATDRLNSAIATDQLNASLGLTPFDERLGAIKDRPSADSEMIAQLLALCEIETGDYPGAQDVLDRKLVGNGDARDFLQAEIREAQEFEKRLAGKLGKPVKAVADAKLSYLQSHRLEDLRFADATLKSVLVATERVKLGGGSQKKPEVIVDDNLRRLEGMRYLDSVMRLLLLQKTFTTKDAGSPILAYAKEDSDPLAYGVAALWRIIISKGDEGILTGERETLESNYAEDSIPPKQYFVALALYYGGRYKDTKSLLETMKNSPGISNDFPLSSLYALTLKKVNGPANRQYIFERDAVSAYLKNPQSGVWKTLDFNDAAVEAANGIKEEELQ
ncbi:MAG: hypothetical protein WCQ50_04545 [Spirochaetota bacterium]